MSKVEKASVAESSGYAPAQFGLNEAFYLAKEVEMRLKIILEPSSEGGFTAHVPSLPGCISEGDTLEEATTKIREAIELYLEPVDDDLVLNEHSVVQEIEL